MNTIEDLFIHLAKNYDFGRKGSLSVALHVTRYAIEKGLPINERDLITEDGEGGQVAGLGKNRVQRILDDHGIKQILAHEGGRTSRGNVKNMRLFVSFLNSARNSHGFDLNKIELWVVDRVMDFFASKPFVLRFDSSKALRSVVEDIFKQAITRQQKTKGATIVGTVLQHLVGAKLELLLGDVVDHHGASVADEVSDRNGDFHIEDVVIHVTTAPTESLIQKCIQNYKSGLRPIIITLDKASTLATDLAGYAGVHDRIDIFEAKQFIAGNLYELGKFQLDGRKETALRLIDAYNKIVDSNETDKGLRIELK